MQDFYTCEPGYEELSVEVANARCVKLVKDMHYEQQVQCIVNYEATFLHKKISKAAARKKKLTRQQYLDVSVDLFFS